MPKAPLPEQLIILNRSFREGLFQNQAKWPLDRSPRLLPVGTYGKTIRDTFSGTTYHLAMSGLKAGVLEGCFSQLSADGINRRLLCRGLLWKLRSLAQNRRPAGFKFTLQYQSALWAGNLAALSGTTLINTFQLFGEPFIAQRRSLGIQACFYIDGTLNEYFSDYAAYDSAEIDSDTIRHALDLEAAGYRDAALIITMSRRTANDLHATYGVDRSKIHVVPPGANLPDDVRVTEARNLGPFTRRNPFTLGFTGLYPRRKGLDRLAAAVAILRKRQRWVRLRVIGNCPPDIRNLDGIEYMGRIDKRIELHRFISVVSSIHLGCMLSRAELAGVAYLEFLRLGIPILGTPVGGSIDILDRQGTIVVDPDVSEEELADTVERVYRDPALYSCLKDNAEGQRDWAGWPRAAAQIDAILNSSLNKATGIRQ